MFCKIELQSKQALNSKNVEKLIWEFLSSLERNGQILKDYKVAKNENYSLYVTFPKPDSFDEKYDGIYVKQNREKIKEYFDYTVTPLGENLESQQYCCCGKRSANRIVCFTKKL